MSSIALFQSRRLTCHSQGNTVTKRAFYSLSSADERRRIYYTASKLDTRFLFTRKCYRSEEVPHTLSEICLAHENKWLTSLHVKHSYLSANFERLVTKSPKYFAHEFGVQRLEKSRPTLPRQNLVCEPSWTGIITHSGRSEHWNERQAECCQPVPTKSCVQLRQWRLLEVGGRDERNSLAL